MRLEITEKGLELYNFISAEIEAYIKHTSIIKKSKIDEIINLLQTIREDAISRFDIKFE